MAPKKRVNGKKPVIHVDTDALGKDIKRAQARQNLEKVIAHLEQDTDLAVNVLYLIESGALASISSDSDSLPSSCNKFRLLKQVRKLDILKRVCPGLDLSLPTLTVWKVIDPKMLDKLFMSVLNIDLNSAVYSKSIRSLNEKCVERANEVNSPLRELKGKLPGLSFSGQCGDDMHGCYIAEPADAEKKTEIVARVGETHFTASLEDFGHDVTKEWKICHNEDAARATLCKGKVAVRLITLFEPDDQKLIRPQRLPVVPLRRSGSGFATPRKSDAESNVGSPSKKRRGGPSGNGGAL